MGTIESYDTVIIGSGFGGTITALTLAKYYELKQAGRACLLERGQWWVSHEIPYTPNKPPKDKNMLEYLADSGQPFNFWAHPDNVEGLFNLLSITRNVNERGIYELTRLSNNVNVITASGVGGGSLVYSNVTIEPDSTIFESWPIKKTDLDAYFSLAKQFIGVNKITTISGLTKQKLERSKVFQDAIIKLATDGDTQIIQEEKNDYSLELSITDIGTRESEVLFADNPNPQDLEKIKKEYHNPYKTNVCQRQARCNLGCLPGARHTLNKRLFGELNKEKPTLFIKPLCEVSEIKLDFADSEYPYIIQYRDIQQEKNSAQIKAKRLVICSGALGSTKLLLNSTGIKFSKKLGEQFSINADMLAYAQLKNKRIDNTRGPINTSHVKFKDANGKFAFNIEDTSVPPMTAGIFANVFENNSTIKSGLSFLRKIQLAFKLGNFGLLRGDSTFLKNFLLMLKDHPLVRDFITQQKVVDKNNPNVIIKDRDEKFREKMGFFYKLANKILSDKNRPFDSPSQRLSKYFIFSCMGLERSSMKLKMENSELKLDNWEPKKETETFNAMTKAVEKIADKIEQGAKVDTVGWSKDDPNSSNFFVLHPIGGCSMGKSVSEGVVNSYGQVFNPDDGKPYSNLFVVDGSIIPSALGVNPSLTIMALTFRCIEQMLRDEGVPEDQIKKYFPIVA